MAKYFTINELTKSTTASKKHIDNTPTQEVINNLNNLIEKVLDPLREAYGKPIIVDSGYRCTKLNKAVGGSTTSEHRCMNGSAAADIRTIPDTPSENKKLFDLIIKLKLPFNQLIDEYGYNWIHISYNSTRNKYEKLRAITKNKKTIYNKIV